MPINEAEFAQLPAAEQLFIALNLERIGRGLPPIMYMTSQLNAYAAQGAARAGDPSVPAVLTGGVPVASGGAIWAGEVSSPLAADYYFMYLDGPGTDSNLACMRGVDCWIHRDAILHEYPGCGAGPAVLSMGAAVRSDGVSRWIDGRGDGEFVRRAGRRHVDVARRRCGRRRRPASSAWPRSPTAPAIGRQRPTGQWPRFGKAPNDGSVTGALNAPIVGMAATPDGGGYWLVGADGGVFSFGDAHFYGSTGSLQAESTHRGAGRRHPTARGTGSSRRTAGSSATAMPSFGAPWAGSRSMSPWSAWPSDAATGGYWEVAADGGIFSFGAPFFGSTGSMRLNQPIVGMEGTPNGLGYRFVAADGGIFSYGTATFEGSTGGLALVAPMVAMAADDATGGYWMAAADGGIFNYGGAAYLGRATSPSLPDALSRPRSHHSPDSPHRGAARRPSLFLAQVRPRPADTCTERRRVRPGGAVTTPASARRAASNCAKSAN